MGNPRAYKPRSANELVNTAFLVTPSDTVDLAVYAIGLRIWNPNATASTVRLETVDGNDVTLTVPATSLIVEPISVARVYTTNTTAGVVIHGYA